MAASPARATPGSDLIRWMQQFEAHIASLQVRGRLGSITGSPRVDKLRQLQNSAQSLLRALSTSFWAQDAGTRQAVQSAYLSALVTVKLFADDVYIETVEEARQPKAVGEAPHQDQVSDIDKTYQQTIETWIIASPLIDPATSVGNDRLLPKISNMIGNPDIRSISRIGTNVAKDKTPPAVIARALVDGEVQRLRNGKGAARLSAEAIHLLGVASLLAQLELKLRWEIDQTMQSDVDQWYQAAARPIQTMSNDILGALDDAHRLAIVNGPPALAEGLLTMRHLAIIDLATLYSYRRQETRVLLTFFEKQNKTGRFAYQDTAIGANRVNETLFAYVARGNPDAQANRAALSIASVRARETELVNKDVKVYGLIDRTRSKLTDEMTKATVLLSGAESFPPRGLSGPAVDRRVLVDGRLTGTGSTLTIAVSSVLPHSEGYRALVGFPLEFAQTGADGNLDQLPRWRRLTDALQRAAVNEHEERAEGVFSVEETLAGQREFVTGLLREEPIRKAFAAPLKKVLDLDLQDTKIRTQAWAALFKQFATNGNRSAVRLLNAFLQRYFDLYTRHTYFNLRDDGKPYLDSKWPIDLINRQLHDCGVYAVTAAYDLFSAIQGTSDIKFEFRFLTFLNHICLVVFFDNAAFLVNNGAISAIIDVVKQGVPSDDDRVSAAFDLGGSAFTTVYNVDYTVFLSVVPRLSLDSDRSDADFRRRIWQMYLDSQGWGTNNDETIAGAYFRSIQQFDESSKALAAQLTRLGSGQAKPAEWDSATTLALQLYDLSEQMSAAKNFVFFNDGFLKKKPVAAVGFSVRPPRSNRLTRTTAGGPPTLPMYQLADLLRRRNSLTPDQLALTKKPTGVKHMIELTNSFNKAAAAPKP